MKEKVKKVCDFEWLLPKGSRDRMRVDAKIIANDAVMGALEDDAITQLTNVACLPGVIEPVVGLPDMHWGYGLPMGAVSAFDADEGIISSGLCGFDINCGVNAIRTNLAADEVRKSMKELIDKLFRNVPCGVGARGRLKLTPGQLDEVLMKGVEWGVKNGYGVKDDIARTEDNGCMHGADPSKVSSLAKQRGRDQLGTLGAGNHFLEIQRVSDIIDPKFSNSLGIEKNDQVMIMLHCGSRGLGHQVATDYLKSQEEAAKKYRIWLPDRQLACAPASSKEGQDFFAAMKAATNYSFTNRLVMTQWIRETFEDVFKRSWQEMDMHTVYAICHNVIKFEEHKIGGEKRRVYVHRKGATRSFPGIPVLIAGTMGTASYILKGTEAAMEKTFGSSCHGAGRAMSREGAIKRFWGGKIREDLLKKGIESRATNPQVLAEEAPLAYKDVEEVINSVHGAGISLKACRMEPIGVLKG